jgi:hypothetical protein
MGIDFMEGEKKKNHSRGGKERNAGIAPCRIHEYDFFLTQDEEVGAGKSVPAEAEKRPETGEGEKERNKSITFFLSE